MKTGLLVLGRPTFDVEFANEKLAAMLAKLDEAGADLVGSRELLLQNDAAEAAIEQLSRAGISRLLVLQVTFTDASLTVKAARALDVPLSIWAVPEPRLGGRLRLNAFCGLNLASHALGLNAIEFSWAYQDPASIAANELNGLLEGGNKSGHLEGAPSVAPKDAGEEILSTVRGSKIGRIGEHPEGFDTCTYNADKLSALADVSVDEIGLDALFQSARKVPGEQLAAVRAEASDTLDGLETVNSEELERSLRLRAALSGIRENGKYDAFAIRCWPETFTQYGGAVCGPVSMMGEAKIPCACEADVYGALTQLILQKTADAPVFLTDLVDVDTSDDTAVIWHCGQAPVSMCKPDTRPQATIHTNRKMPLLYQFALKPGRVTLMRISQAFGKTKMILGGGEMLDRPMAFTGTSGTLRFDGGSKKTLDNIIASGLEHHMALAYGDHCETLKSVATALDIPVLEV